MELVHFKLYPNFIINEDIDNTWEKFEELFFYYHI